MTKYIEMRIWIDEDNFDIQSVAEELKDYLYDNDSSVVKDVTYEIKDNVEEKD